MKFGPPDDTEVDPLAAVLSPSFHFPPEESRKVVARAGRQARVLRRDGEVLAGLLMHEMGQFQGGREIPMGGIGAVGVAPHGRGTGVAATLTPETIRELRDGGIPLFTLYASTQRLYRKVGCEPGSTEVRRARTCSSSPSRSIASTSSTGISSD